MAVDCLFVGNMQCGELATTVVVKKENATDISSELHLLEPEADGLTALAEPISVENSDNTMTSVDTAKVQNEPSVTSTSIPADSNVGTEVVPQSVDSGSVTDTGLKESVLQECLTRTLHRSFLLLFI